MKIVRPDFIFFVERLGKVVAKLVDSHGFNQDDALAKLQGLARYAEIYLHAFRRIEAKAVLDGNPHMLGMTCTQIRQAVVTAFSV